MDWRRPVYCPVGWPGGFVRHHVNFAPGVLDSSAKIESPGWS